jgi:hypothetical protein
MRTLLDMPACCLSIISAINLEVLPGEDWGIDLRAEYIFNMGFFISLDYDAGIENLVPTAQSGTIHNYTSDISIGILFLPKSNR